MESFDRISWDKTSSELRSFVNRRVKDKALTDDIVQDIFIKIHYKLGQLNDSEKINAWIYQIARNTITDHFRARSRKIFFSDFNNNNDNQILNDCVQTCLEEMLITLPSKYREALELTEKQNLSQIELTERLSISYSGAKSRVQRARQLLKEMITKKYNIETDSYGNVMVCESKQPCNCSSLTEDQ